MHTANFCAGTWYVYMYILLMYVWIKCWHTVAAPMNNGARVVRTATKDSLLLLEACHHSRRSDCQGVIVQAASATMTQAE